MNKTFAVILITLTLLSCSCGYYSTTSRTAGDIKKIYIPYMENETPEPNVEIEITQRIIDGIIKDNTLKVVSEDEADATLEGALIEYSNEPYTFSENASSSIQAEQYRLVIGIRISLFDGDKNEYLWEDKKIEARGDYYLEATEQQNYEDAKENVYTDLVDGILSNTLEDW